MGFHPNRLNVRGAEVWQITYTRPPVLAPAN
jgi:hypothetical protein